MKIFRKMRAIISPKIRAERRHWSNLWVLWELKLRPSDKQMRRMGWK